MPYVQGGCKRKGLALCAGSGEEDKLMKTVLVSFNESSLVNGAGGTFCFHKLSAKTTSLLDLEPSYLLLSILPSFCVHDCVCVWCLSWGLV